MSQTRKVLTAVTVFLASVALAGCSQTASNTSGKSTSDSAAAGSAAVEAVVSKSANTARPAAFADRPLNIAVVRQLNAGDVYENWIAGVRSEAEKLNAKLTIYNADGDNAKQAQMLSQAVATKPDGILIGWGFYNSLKPGIAEAKKAGIPVTTYYVNAELQDGLVTMDQGDDKMMNGILEQAKKDIGGEGEVIYVYVSGYQALDLRNEAMEAFLKKNPGIKVVSTIGKISSSTASEVASQLKAAVTAHPNVKAVIAPYDEFAKGATTGVNQLGKQDSIKVYGMDISTADIAVMTAPNSPWKVTATTDQANVGSAALRMSVLQAAGELEGNHVSVPPVVISQEELRQKSITDVSQLGQAFPDLSTPDLLRAPWMSK